MLGEINKFAVWSFTGGFAAVLMVSGLQGCGHRSDVLAVINGQKIGMPEYYQYLQNKASVSVIMENGSASLPVEGSLGFQAMRDVVEQNVELQIAKDKGLYPTSGEVDNELTLRMKENPSYLVGMMGAGFSLDVIKKSITVELAQEKILSQGVSVSSAETDAYIKSHPSGFVSPELVDLSWILVKSASDEPAVDQYINSGESFGSVASRYSKAPNAQGSNGKFSTDAVAATTLPEEIQSAIAKIKDGDTTPWIEVEGGFAKYYLNKRTPSKPIVLDSFKKEQLRRNIAKSKGMAIHNLPQMIMDKLRSSKVEVLQPQYFEAWHAEMDALKAQAKQQP